MTSSSADGSVIIIWDDTPVPNSGQYDTRPEYFGDAFWFADGTLTSVGGGLAGGVATLEANKTYYMSSFSISFEGPLSTGTFTTTIDQAIRTTAATREYDCADIGTVVETLYVFDAAGNVDSATADVTVSGTAGTGAGTFPVAITQAASFNLDDLGGNATLVPSNINNGSTFPFCSDTFLSFETTSYTQTTTTSSPTDVLVPEDTFPYVSSSAFTVPTSGDYAFSMTSSSADQSLLIIWDDTPVPNSGFFVGRPEYFGSATWESDGTENSSEDGLAGGVATLEANKTYYISTASVEAPGDIGTFTTTIDQAIRTTAATREYDCADIGTVVETLYVFDAAGNVDSATADVTVQGVLTTYTAGIWDNGAPTMGSKAVINTPLVTNGTSIEACACDVNAALTIEGGDYLRVNSDIVINATGSLTVAHTGSVVQVQETATTTNGGAISVLVDTPDLDVLDFMVMGSPMSAETREGVWSTAWNVQDHTTANFNSIAGVTGFNFLDTELDDWSLYATGTLDAGEGFLVRPQDSYNGAGGVFNYDFNTGTLNSGVVTQTLDFNVTELESPNMLSNPYASAIDADAFLTANPEIIGLYFWEHNLAPSTTYPGANSVGNNYSMDDVSFYNTLGGVAATSGGAAPNGVISTGQGFGVFATAGGTATFNNAMRLTSGNTTLRNNPIAKDRLWLQVTSTMYNASGNTLVGFLEDATAGIDTNYDNGRIASVVSLYSHIE
ncbi:hypothetical protein N9906_04625, partial [Flavobacteriaceae bacterium]|nr:hypothetical protein [Flavobacteriaceae bacterium]